VTDSWDELLMKDHETIERVLAAVLGALDRPEGPPPEMVGAFLEYMVEFTDGCHNQKEEQHLFPLLAQRGVPKSGGPLAVMLMEHEQSRQYLAALRPLATRYAQGDRTVRDDLAAVVAPYAELLKGHYWKENDILYPLGRRVLSEADAGQVLAGIEAIEASLGPDTRARYSALAARIQDQGALKDLSANLSPEALAAMLNTLPVELSFVDDQDRVRYFSHENRPKIFGRSRGVIGMPVRDCHPEKSVHLVTRILEDFKAGAREVAEFWIDMAGKKIHIRYFPVRSPEGRYLGCLEVVQDITAIQALQGQRRLLDESV
jgi:uncharacterized protein